MNEINQLANISFRDTFVSVVAIMIAVKFLVSLTGWICDKFGIEIKHFRRQKEDHELLLKTINDLADLHIKHEADIKKSTENDEQIKTDIKNLSNMFLDLEMQNIRWNILNFCSELSNGKEFSNEHYDYVFKLYDKYEKMLEENGLTNGLVDQSIEFIRDEYKRKLANGKN